MFNRKVVLAAIALHVVFAGVAVACPYCGYSPSGWGFCKYGGYAGPYDCDTYVADPFSGRTACAVCGYCNWNDPNGSQACNAGGDDDEDCGLVTPCDQTRLVIPTLLPSDTCPSPSRALTSEFGWMGVRADEVVIF